MLERARKLIADARRGSTPTTEIIRASPESVKAFSETEERLQKMSDELGKLMKQSSIGNFCLCFTANLRFNNVFCRI